MGTRHLIGVVTGNGMASYPKSKDDSEYYPVALAQLYWLDDLPTVEDFLSDFAPDEEEEQ